MQYLEEQILSWKYMAWRVFLKKTWMREEECWSKRTKVERERSAFCPALFISIPDDYYACHYFQKH